MPFDQSTTTKKNFRIRPFGKFKAKRFYKAISIFKIFQFACIFLLTLILNTLPLTKNYFFMFVSYILVVFES